MKSTEIIEPAAFSQPVAAQGTRNEIPQEATGSNLASVAEGFPDITMISPTDGGLPPFGQDFNGLFYLTTTQWVYLQNGGFITFNQNVSDAIGGYPQGAILGYINSDNILYNVRSLIDDNTYNFNENSNYINSEYWELLSTQSSDLANNKLSNLTATGLSQYNAFCINTGSVDDSGNPTFLTLTESTQTTTDEETEEETTTITYTLTTSGSFDVTTANGTIYTISDTLEYTADDLEDGTYKIFIDPVNKSISLTQNEITYGSAFPSTAVSGDYLLNTSQVPYDFQKITITTDTDEETEEETTTSTVESGLTLVYAGVLTVSGGGSLSLNSYNENITLNKVLTGKADVDLSNCTVPYVIETYSSGTSWYRLYSDGWCEQGNTVSTANTTIYFLIPYADTNYTIASVGLVIAGYGAQYIGKATTHFSTSSSVNTTSTLSWVTYGYTS